MEEPCSAGPLHRMRTKFLTVSVRVGYEMLMSHSFQEETRKIFKM